MQEVNPEQKNSAIKTLAIVGFITALVLGVWLAVQAVRYAPEAFRSLASMAEFINAKDPRFVVSTEKNIVNTGESFKVSWTHMRREGDYAFRFSCTDGIAAEVKGADGSLSPISCDSDVSLPNDKTETEVVFSSEKKRFTDVPFAIRYTPAVNMEAVEEQNALVTVVNVALAEDRENEDGEVASAEDAKDEGDESPETPATVKPETETPKPAPVLTRPEPVVTTAIPVSNPNGYTDLAVRFIAIGSFNNDTRHFTPRTSLDNDMHGAVQFEVKNIGTKTSSDWTYRVTLPTDDTDVYVSPSQAPLKPNERAVITIAFDDTTNDTGTERIHIEVRGGTDSVSGNNTLTQSVKVTD